MLEDEGILFFRTRIYSQEVILPKLSTIDKVIRFQGAGATPVHKAIEAGHLHMVNEVFINEM